jgi:hypothetical protein
MNQRVEVDLTDMEKKLKCYVNKGRVAGSAEVRKEPMISVKADASLIKPLKKLLRTLVASLLSTALHVL